MYVVRDKKTKKILHINPAPLSQALENKQVYYQYDKKSMEMGRSNSTLLPKHFDITRDHKIVEISLNEQVQRGLLELKKGEAVYENQVIQLSEDQKIISVKGKEKIVELSLKDQQEKGLITIDEPFEFINEKTNEILRRSLHELEKNNHISSKAVAIRVNNRISDQITKEISQMYPHHEEMEIVKGYMDWIVEGQPSRDERSDNYKKMQADILEIKKKYASVKKKVEAFMPSRSKKTTNKVKAVRKKTALKTSTKKTSARKEVIKKATKKRGR